MATDMQKMLRLVTEQTGVGRIEDPDAESVMQDESGREYLRLEMRVHRDIVKEARYVADGEVNVNVAAAMAAVTQIAQGKAIMVATLIKPADIEKELSDGFRSVTNNQMELLAVITGLEALKKPCNVTLYSDSKYVVDAFKNNWIDGWIKKGWKTAGKAPVKNVGLWQRLLKAKEPHDVEFVWVKGHAGHEYNERCDTLAVKASKQDNLKDLDQ